MFQANGKITVSTYEQRVTSDADPFTYRPMYIIYTHTRTHTHTHIYIYIYI